MRGARVWAAVARAARAFSSRAGSVALPNHPRVLGALDQTTRGGQRTNGACRGDRRGWPHRVPLRTHVAPAGQGRAVSLREGVGGGGGLWPSGGGGAATPPPPRARRAVVRNPGKHESKWPASPALTVVRGDVTDEKVRRAGRRAGGPCATAARALSGPCPPPPRSRTPPVTQSLREALAGCEGVIYAASASGYLQAKAVDEQARWGVGRGGGRAGGGRARTAPAHSARPPARRGWRTRRRRSRRLRCLGGWCWCPLAWSPPTTSATPSA